MHRLWVGIAFVAAALLSLGLVASGASANCGVDCKSTCAGHGIYEINWSLLCTGSSCTVLRTELYRACPHSTTWTLIATNPRSPYFDVQPTSVCAAAGFQYRVDVVWSCNDGTGHGSCVAGPIYCP